MTGPLAGFKVIDVTEGAQGPWAAALIADLGANVIKVEKPAGDLMRPTSGPGRPGGFPGSVFRGMNHGKRNISLDLKNPEDRDILYALAREADVFMENWRPGVAKRLGVDFETLSAINPKLVYLSAAGFGQTGIYGPKPSMENTSAAMGGYGSLSGPRGDLGEKPRFVVIDFASPLPVLQGIVLALIARNKTGRGQWVQCSQLLSLAFISSVRVAEYLMTGRAPQPWGSGVPYSVPSQAFKTADAHIFVDCRHENDWKALCDAIKLPNLATDERFNSNARRVENEQELIPLLETAFRRFRAGRWLKLLKSAGIPCGEVHLDIEDLYEDPQVVANGLLVDRPDKYLGSVRTNAVPWEFSRTPAEYGALHPDLNADREEILAEMKVLGAV